MARCLDPNFVFRISPQMLGNPDSGGMDCGPTSTMELLHWASCGLWPGLRNVDGFLAFRDWRSEQVTRIRELGGMPSGLTGTNPYQNSIAFRKVTEQDFPALGLEPQTPVYYGGTVFNDTLLPKLQAGWSASVSLGTYDVYNWNGGAAAASLVDRRDYWPGPGYALAPPWYNVRHTVAITNYRVIGGVEYVDMADPLYSGLYHSGLKRNRPRTPQPIALDAIRSACAERVTTAPGRVYGYAVRRAVMVQAGTSGLAASSAIGTSNFKLYSTDGMQAGQYLDIGPPSYERLIIAGVGSPGGGGTGITTTTSATKAHALNAQAVTGDLDPVIPDTGFDPNPQDPCGEGSNE